MCANFINIWTNNNENQSTHASFVHLLSSRIRNMVNYLSRNRSRMHLPTNGKFIWIIPVSLCRCLFGFCSFRTCGRRHTKFQWATDFFMIQTFHQQVSSTFTAYDFSCHRSSRLVLYPVSDTNTNNIYLAMLSWNDKVPKRHHLSFYIRKWNHPDLSIPKKHTNLLNHTHWLLIKMNFDDFNSKINSILCVCFWIILSHFTWMSIN